MNLKNKLEERSNHSCELCSSKNELIIYTVAPFEDESEEHSILICSTCLYQIENLDQVDANHWRCLNDSIWNEVEVVKVVSWRMLNQLKREGWPSDLLNMMYLEDETLEWAKKTIEETEEKVIHRDSNGAVIEAGDTVVLIKDLNVKGAGFTAKRGTAVRNISLVYDNSEQIEGRVNGQQIVILTQFVKKNT